jgi:hypothetical protein
MLCSLLLAVELMFRGAASAGESVSWLLGVEFDTPENFWGIENPPADWRV